MADKLSVAEINKIRLKYQVSDPADPPPTGYAYLFAKDDGLYVMLEDETVLGPFGEGGGGGGDTPTLAEVLAESNNANEEAITNLADPTDAQDAATKAYVDAEIAGVGGGADGDAIHDNVSGEIAAITGKTTPVDADVTLIEDSADSNSKKKLTWANLKATLKTYFDTLYAAVSHTHAYSSLTSIPSTFAPSTHASSHQSGGGDAIKLDDLATPDDNTDLNASTSRHGLLKKLSNISTEYMDGTGAWSTPAGGGGGGAPTGAKYLTVEAHASLSDEVVIPGFAGSPDRAGVAGSGTSEEYDSATTGLTWSNTPTTVDSNTTIPSNLYCLVPANGTERLGTKSWAPGSGAFDARIKFTGFGINFTGANAFFGFHIGDSGNSNRLMIQAQVGSTMELQAYTYASSSYTQRGSSVSIATNNIYLRITRDASNNISFWCSTNGLFWRLIATEAFTLTVDNIGIRLSGNTAGTSECAVDWLRTG